jgi:uncharacterized membrane protein
LNALTASPRYRIRYLPPALAGRPRLTLSLALGVVVAAVLAVSPNALNWSGVAIAAWDATCAAYILGMMLLMRGQDPAAIQARAAQEDEGQGFILALVIVAAAVSLVAVGAELSVAKREAGVLQAATVGAVVATVAASWFMIQLIFSVHYAHEYYRTDDSPDGRVGGLGFPGDEPPDYWDFLHFSVVIGVASQTADITFTAKTLRRIGTVHSVVAFAFNTVVLALTINLLATLF